MSKCHKNDTLIAILLLLTETNMKKTFPITIFFVLVFIPQLAFGTDPSGGSEISWFELLSGLFGGLALFLYGMDRMGDALKAAAGSKMRGFLSAVSNNRFKGLLTGAGVTAVIQSSSVTTVMLVGFVSASLMTMPQTIGIILGAGIGTTITAQIVAFKVTKMALALIAVGFTMLFVGRTERWRHYGYIVMGLGLIFFGMTTMSHAMYPLREYPPFLAAMQGMDNPLQGILVAAVFTGLVQSSSATMGIVIVLAQQGLISLEAGIALALGANIGTCATAGLAAIGKSREAVRVAVAHVFFKVLGVIIIFPFIQPFGELVVSFSPQGDPTLSAEAFRAAVVPRQVANAHTLFNVTLAFLFLPFTEPFAKLIVKMVPERKEKLDPSILTAKYLDKLLLRSPPLALEASRAEIMRMGSFVSTLAQDAMPLVLKGDAASLQELKERDEPIDHLYGLILSYVRQIGENDLSRVQTEEMMTLLTIANELEAVGDTVERTLVVIGERRLKEEVIVSDSTLTRLMELHEVARTSLDMSITAFGTNNHELAKKVISLKPEVNRRTARAEQHQIERLISQDPKRHATYAVEKDTIDGLKSIYYHAKRMAKAIIGVRDTLSRPLTREFPAIKTKNE